jgi:thioredoxin-like negative regulator of GroEL
MKVNQYQRVKDLLHKYTIIQPTNAQVFCLMAETLQQTNDTENAKSWLVKKKKEIRKDLQEIQYLPLSFPLLNR